MQCNGVSIGSTTSTTMDRRSNIQSVEEETEIITNKCRETRGMNIKTLLKYYFSPIIESKINAHGWQGCGTAGGDSLYKYGFGTALTTPFIYIPRKITHIGTSKPVQETC